MTARTNMPFKNQPDIIKGEKTSHHLTLNMWFNILVYVCVCECVCSPKWSKNTINIIYFHFTRVTNSGWDRKKREEKGFGLKENDSNIGFGVHSFPHIIIFTLGIIFAKDTIIKRYCGIQISQLQYIHPNF